MNSAVPRRLLFMAHLGKTLHEVTIGLDLADQLRSAGVESHFVIDPFNTGQLTTAGFPYTLVEPAMGHGLRSAVAETVRTFRPDAIVLSDYLAHWMTCLVSYDLDPWFIDDFGIPVIPIDLFGLERTSREVEILGRTVEVSDRILSMPAQLRPVPMGHFDDGPSGRGFPYRANHTIRPMGQDERREIRRGLGLRDDDRLLMIPTLPWQQIMAERAAPATRGLATRLPELIAGYLARLPSRTHFLMTGPLFDGFRGLPAERVHSRPSYTAVEYHDLLRAADGVLSFHLPSYALERAVFADVPGLYAVNGFEVDGEAGIERVAKELSGLGPTARGWLRAYPGTVPEFHMWPLRWNRVLRPLLTDNPFTATALGAQILDEETVVSGLKRLLYDEETRDRLAAAREAYRNAAEALPPTVEVFEAAAARAGVR
ncbi:DUF6365 family protein [Streptomyces gobiensis]|uniref:DUF6365 family protein n=1 Tax=Streptomyces gobiensis TaxID=2875706 RepID=UPI001E2FFE4A|nr:DUF6365 family protein [Streptomyces gobiensis]UGY93011.1 DUF6365 family protein [Streptomyces gobiensis]